MMICPKCGYEQADGEAACGRCGIIMAKYERQQLRKAEAKTRLRQELLALPIPEPGNRLYFFVRIGVLLLLAWFSWRLIPTSPASNAAGESVLHLINLPFHEAGHLLFRPFGAFITSLGGTLGQLLMPLVCLVAMAFKYRDAFGASVCLWWLGESLLDIAPYIDDARSQTLPLLGGNSGATAPYGFHDWAYILNESGLLHFDHTLAMTAHVAGSLLMLAAMLMAVYWLWRQHRLLDKG
jgi:hypothetical protein